MRDKKTPPRNLKRTRPKIRVPRYHRSLLFSPNWRREKRSLTALSGRLPEGLVSSLRTVLPLLLKVSPHKRDATSKIGATFARGFSTQALSASLGLSVEGARATLPLDESIAERIRAYKGAGWPTRTSPKSTSARLGQRAYRTRHPRSGRSYPIDNRSPRVPNRAFRRAPERRRASMSGEAVLGAKEAFQDVIRLFGHAD